MKLTLILLIAFLACNNPKSPTVGIIYTDSCAYYKHEDSVLIAQLYDSLDNMSLELAASGQGTQVHDQLKKENDSLRSRLFVVNYKIERVRYYLNIALQNPSQDKFLKGWVKRAIE